MDHTITINTDQLDALTELLSEYRDSVASGKISGFHQPQTDELADVDELAAILRDAR